jgi:hypothetical protein
MGNIFSCYSRSQVLSTMDLYHKEKSNKPASEQSFLLREYVTIDKNKKFKMPL